ncbi:MAG TPA: VWA domain-containing protein [Candidatus Sulfotelmatobacter sp.]|jgi:Ca-activated chloride channel family protein|nr:VWA domain-containing protein [Candidatus Sulfotelmatobacter sp.]
MRLRLLGFFVSIGLLGSALLLAQQQNPSNPPAAPPPPPQEPLQKSQTKITTTVNLVDVLFTVLDRRNKLVPTLEKQDFRVLDDNAAQDIRYFSRQSDLPLRIGMLLDTSNSIRDRIKFEQDAANNFLFSVLRRGKDEAFVMTFDDEPQVVQAFTPDTGKLRDQILRTRAGGGTAVYDAIYDACDQELSHPPRPPGDQPDVVRRVMILISDGEDNLSTHTRAEAIEMAQRSSVVIYTISTSTQWVTLDDPSKERTGNRKYHLTDGDKILQALAEETGGRAFYPYHVDDLDQSFQDIGDELRNQYSIAYNPSTHALDGRYHKIRIDVPEHKGYQVRARKGYFARTNVEPLKPAGAVK